jgi:hypothetical protein
VIILIMTKHWKLPDRQNKKLYIKALSRISGESFFVWQKVSALEAFQLGQFLYIHVFTALKFIHAILCLFCKL